LKIIKQARKISLKLSDNNQKHCNKLPFKGTVMKLDTPSEGSPHNTCQIVKPIMLSKKEAMNSANTMNFMGIDCVWADDDEDTSDDMTGHDARFKIGVISNCYVEGSELKVEGFIYASDFPDIADYIKHNKSEIGFSVEMLCRAEELDDYINVTDVEFTGVAMLFKDCAAYQSTYIDYIAAQRKDIKNKMDETKVKELLAEQNKVLCEAVGKLIEPLKADVEKLKEAKVEAKKVEVTEPEKTVSKESVEELSAKFDTMEEKANKSLEAIAEFIKKFEQEEEATVNASKVEEKGNEVVTPDLALKKTSAKFEASDNGKPKTFADLVLGTLNK
jgi:hypothetical protein